MKKRSVIIQSGVFLVLLVAVISTVFHKYTGDYYRAKEYGAEVECTEETEDYIVYGEKESASGLIFYPGAKVEETAYAPILNALAETGICCVVVKMPYHLAVFDSDAAEQVMEDIPGVAHWYLGGHSLGGAMAANYAAKQEEALEGLVLLAAYPTRELEELPVLSIYGSEDGVLNREKYEKSIGLSHVLTERVIEGGNHAGFGDYGPQKGDGTALVSEEEQWQETVDYILNFMMDNREDAE